MSLPRIGVIYVRVLHVRMLERRQVEHKFSYSFLGGFPVAGRQRSLRRDILRLQVRPELRAKVPHGRHSQEHRRRLWALLRLQPG